MDPELQTAIDNDDVDELHRLIVKERNLLDHASQDPFPCTPLHIAAAAGKTQVAMEVAILMPSVSWKLDAEGYSPMHLALRHEHYHTARALMTLDHELIRVKGRCGITPLHYVAGKKGDNELELLAKFLSACKSAIEDLTSRCETAVHIAVKNHNLKAFKILFGWLQRVDLTEILDWKDQDGNTVLHIAVSKKQPEIINLLIGHANVNAKNFQDKTALDIFKENRSSTLDIFEENCSGVPDIAEKLHRQGTRAKYSTHTLSPSKFFSRELTRFEKCANFFRVQDESARNNILVVSTLVASATYQAAFTPPGGYWTDSSSTPAANSTVVTANSSSVAPENPHHAGNLILDGQKLFWYVMFNSVAFFASITSILTVIAFAPEARTFIMVSPSLIILCIAYLISFEIQLPKHGAAEFSLFVVYELFAISVLVLLLFMRIQHRAVQLDGTGRSRRRFPGSKD